MITCTSETYQEDEVIRLVLENYEQGLALHKQAVFRSNAFTFEILETLEKKEEQSQEEFLDDLKTIEQMWGENLDSSKIY